MASVPSGYWASQGTRVEDAGVVLWGPNGKAQSWNGNEPVAYVDLHQLPGHVERADQRHVAYSRPPQSALDLLPLPEADLWASAVRGSVLTVRQSPRPRLAAEPPIRPSGTLSVPAHSC